MAAGLETKVMSGQEAIAKAANLLRGGDIAAIPTETVYGLAASAFDERAVSKIFEAKGRPQDNPLIVHVAEKEQVTAACTHVPKRAEALIDAFWPGPLSIILMKSQRVPRVVSGGLDTVAVRMPAHETALAVIRQAGVPLAAPSANLSGRPSPTCAEHVLADMNGRIPLIVDGGPCEVGVESTVLDLTAEIPVILRPGAITAELLEQVIGPVQVHSGRLAAGVRAPSPGMKYAHYCPRAAVHFFGGERSAVAKTVRTMYHAHQENGGRPLILCEADALPCYEGLQVRSMGQGRTDAENRLFRELREADEHGIDAIYFHYEPAMGPAVLNRITRAAQPKPRGG